MASHARRTWGRNGSPLLWVRCGNRRVLAVLDSLPPWPVMLSGPRGLNVCLVAGVAYERQDGHTRPIDLHVTCRSCPAGHDIDAAALQEALDRLGKPRATGARDLARSTRRHARSVDVRTLAPR